MKDKIVDIEGKKFLMNFSNKKIIEISDYNIPQKGTLTSFSYVSEIKKHTYCGHDYNEYVKKWGFINENNEVIIPCIYDRVEKFDGVFTGIINHKRFNFDVNGIPINIYKVNGKRVVIHFIEWQSVMEFENKPLSIGKKNEKFGIVKWDGKCFLAPEYDEIDINWSKKCITTRQNGQKNQIIYFEGEKCWSPIQQDFSFIDRILGLCILKKGENFAAIDENRNFVIGPYFSSLNVFKNIVISVYKSKVGILSRTDTFQKTFYAPILPFEYDQIKNGPHHQLISSMIVTYLIIVKDGLQGIFSVDEKKVILEPTIKKDITLYPDTVGENAIGYSRRNEEYGFIDFNGNILFQIEPYLYFKGKRTNIRRPVYFSMGGFKNGIVYIERNGRCTEKYNRKGELLNRSMTSYSHDENIDYKAETWDAMTDGMYGDMPDGFDDDYSFLGH